MRRATWFLLACGCSGTGAPSNFIPDAETAPLSLAADRQMLRVAAGDFRRGSTVLERQQAYDDFLATAGSDGARQAKWFSREAESSTAYLKSYRFDRAPVTQAAYAEFVRQSGVDAPSIDEVTWKAQGFIQPYQTEVKRFNWKDGHPPKARSDHPVVLVTWADARAYCQWRGEIVGQSRRLPSANEFEKAARGPAQAIYPWGESYDASRLNSADSGERDTSAVGSYPQGRSPLGAEDVAGNVFQWTSTPWSAGRMTVKGSAWDDHGGLGRAAAGHGRRKGIRHAIVGFRCAGS